MQLALVFYLRLRLAPPHVVLGTAYIPPILCDPSAPQRRITGPLTDEDGEWQLGLRI